MPASSSPPLPRTFIVRITIITRSFSRSHRSLPRTIASIPAQAARSVLRTRARVCPPSFDASFLGHIIQQGQF